MKTLIGRNYELNYLENNYILKGNQIIIVYGKRNVGKTTLIKEFIKNKPSFYYIARSCSESEQQYLLAKELGIASLHNEDIIDAILNKNTDNKTKQVIIIDEFQNLVKNNSILLQELSKQKEDKAHNQKFLLILVSSMTGWVENQMIRKSFSNTLLLNGLLKVKELCFTDLLNDFRTYSMKECITVYSILGGFPGLWNCIDDKNALKENIVQTVLNKHSIMYAEAD